MHWRRFAVSSIPLDSLEAFDEWLQKRWLEKEELLEQHALTGRFPSSLKNGESLTTHLRLGNWWEVLRMGGVLALAVTAFTVLPVFWKKLF